MNEFQNTINSEPEVEPKVPKSNQQAEEHGASKVGTLKSILVGEFFVRKNVIKLLPFLIYLTCIGMLYIFNSNYANRTVISISKTKKQIEEQRFEFINYKSKLMHTTRQTEIAKRLNSSGLKESKTPPRKILIEQTRN